MKDQSFNRQGSIYVIKFLRECERTYDSSQIHEGVAVWHFGKAMCGPALADIKTRWTLLSNDPNKYERTISSYAGVVNHLIGRYSTNPVIAKANKDIRSFKQCSLTPWDLSEKLWDLTLTCEDVQKEQTLPELFFGIINIRTCSIMQCWWANNREATLGDLDHQAQFVLDLQSGNHQSTENDSQWTGVDRRTNKATRGREKSRRAMAIYDDGNLSSSNKNDPLLERSRVQFVNQVASAPANKVYESDICFMNNGTYCPVFYSSNHVTSEYRHLNQDNQFLRGQEEEL